MTYMHKLAKRLASNHRRALVAALAAIGCAGEQPSDSQYLFSQILILPDSATVEPRDTVGFTAVGLTTGADSVPVPVIWSAEGGTIDANGVFVADSVEGTYQVSAEPLAASRSGGAKARVTIRGHVASVRVAPDNATLSAGQTIELRATAYDAAGKILIRRSMSWSSSARDVATVNGLGLVTAVAPGTVTITASTEGRSGTATTTVTATTVPVASVGVTPASATANVGQTVQLTATPRDAAGTTLAGRAVTWSSNASGVATVNGSGLVTAIAPGTATITGTSEGQSGTATITVSATTVPVASVGVTPSSANPSVGQTVQLTATPRDAAGNALTGRAMTWSTSASGVATVSNGGLVTAVAVGGATITATSEGRSGSATITVAFVPVASVSVTPATATAVVGETVPLTATPRDAAGNALTGRAIAWSTSASGVATVNSSGLVTVVSAGTATITATSEGRSGSAVITGSASGFAPPDLVNNASFELQWEGFTNGATADPTSVTFSTDRAYTGAYSAKRVITASPNPLGGVAVKRPTWSGRDELYARFYFYATGNFPTTWHKTFSLNSGATRRTATLEFVQRGGRNVIEVIYVDSDPSGTGGTIEVGTIALNEWHCVEIHFQKNGLATPRARFWYDGQPVTAATTRGSGRWDGTWLDAGSRLDAAQIDGMDFAGIVNAGNTNSSVMYFDRIAVSTQRIGN